ncbi:MAG: LD-carboxypeptidase [Candidatus Kapaibacterium sp.]
MKNRRDFIAALTLAAIGLPARAGAMRGDPQDVLFSESKSESRPGIIFPPGLRKGSRVAITAPASPTSMWGISHGMKAFKRLGCHVEVGNTIKKHEYKYRYFSASDEERASELMEYAERPDIDCILCARGGYGVMRILPMLDFDIFRRNPKIIMGFSDITALINALYFKTGLVGFHGPVASSTFDSFTIENMKKMILQNSDFKPLRISHPTMHSFSPGKARGRLLGGNLSMLTSTLGTDYEIDSRGAVLFIEEVDEHAYKIDRMLTQLKLSGKLDDAAAIAIGYFKNLNYRRPFYPNKSFSLMEVFGQILGSLKKPVILGLPIGHINNKLTLPIGIEAELNADDNSFTILQKPVAIA